MLAFLESALLQSAQTQTDASESGDFEQRLGSLMTQVGKQPTIKKPEGSPEPEPESASSPAGVGAAPKTQVMMATVLLELVNIAAQVARVDKMIAQVTEGAPDTDEAKRWHEISLQALRCSRDMLSQKQAQCLAGLRTSAPKVVTGDMEVPPVPELAPATTPPGLPPPETPANWMGWSQEAVAACPEFVPKMTVSENGGGSLRRDLEVLRERNPECVMIVRKIKKLGFESPTLLAEHFGQYGQVAEILVAHSRVRPTPKRPNGRVRPAALGFLVMGSQEGVKCALQAGAVQEVCGVTIEVSGFESFDCFYADGEEEQ